MCVRKRERQGDLLLSDLLLELLLLHFQRERACAIERDRERARERARGREAERERGRVCE